MKNASELSSVTESIVEKLAKVKSMDELKVISAQLGIRWRQIQSGADRKVITKLHIGQKVWFKGKYGVRVTGQIAKINDRTVSIDKCSDGRRWRVGASHCFPLKTKSK